MTIKFWMSSLSLSLLTVGCDADVADESEGSPPDSARNPSLEPESPRGGFEDYLREQVIQEPDGSWLVETDIIFSNKKAVRNYYEQHVLGAVSECDESGICPRNLVYQTGSRDDVWNVHEKLAIGYCIGNLGSDPTAYARVKAALDEAARDWGRTADINFVHIVSEDGSGCTSGVNGVLFKVDRKASCSLPTQFGGATVPSDTPGRFYFCDYGLGLDASNLLRATKHELGHVLGLGHEHNLWAQSNTTCLNNYNDPTRNLTYADENSIMGYDFCNGIADGNSTLSYGDRLGVHRLYNIAKGHGRLAGTWYKQANSFRGVGISDDIVWYTPGSGGYQVWSTSTTNSASITFTKATPGSGLMDEYSRPLGVQWHSDGDANLDREIVFFAPGTLTDKIFTNNSNGSFTSSSVTINGYSIPLTGYFHNGTYSEILWWNPVGGNSLLWRTDGSNGITQTTATTAYDGGVRDLDFSYKKALVGNFGHTGNQGTEILMYGDCTAYTTKGTGTTGFSTKFVDMYSWVGTCQTDEYIPLLGDFNGDNYGDIFWYGPGDLVDRLVLLYGTLDITLPGLGGMDILATPVAGHYKPMVADYNGDGVSDIFWYRPGSESDPLWLFNTQGGYTSVTRTVTGDYAPIAGDFNTDGCDDILWFDAPADELIVWRSDCDGTFTAQASHSVPSDSYPVGYGIGF